MNQTYTRLRLILGDQLNLHHSWFSEKADDCLYVMMEMRQETDYVVHHIQKIVGFFAAMRAFATRLTTLGVQVKYLTLDDADNRQQLGANILFLIDHYGVQEFEYQEPDEYRLDQQLKHICISLSIPTRSCSAEHFLCKREEFAQFFLGKKTYMMENFYRYMRRKHHLMMDGDKPIGGKWNFDQENRKKLPQNHTIPKPKLFPKDVSKLVELIRTSEVSYIGEIDSENFIWPIDREESLELLQHFLQVCLPLFGRYQDALTSRSWSVYHARLSFSLNSKMLNPKEVVDAAISHWKAHQNEITLPQIEGFIRQIIGWREYMRGIYWTHMPEYAHGNFFGHTRPLPQYYWTGDCKMNCLHKAISQSLHYAYAHHIQRLMVTGNFALLAGIDPDKVDQWYLGIYIDAIEWVEITNTRGMSQFADGGLVGTKPYVSSANYMDKMGDYCRDCFYDKKAKVGDRACPFNSLYWHFFVRNRRALQANPRVSMMYRVWDKKEASQQHAILEQAETYLAQIERL